MRSRRILRYEGAFWGQITQWVPRNEVVSLYFLSLFLLKYLAQGDCKGAELTCETD